MSEYIDCACRDCFDIAVSDGARELCCQCQQAGCVIFPYEGCDRTRPADYDCQRTDDCDDCGDDCDACTTGREIAAHMAMPDSLRGRALRDLAARYEL